MTNSSSPSDPRVGESSELERLRAEVEQYRTWLSRISEVCEAAGRGNLEERVLRCSVDGVLGRTAHSLNHALDIIDAFVREASAALDAAAHGRFFRRVIMRGMLGTFSHASELINAASGKMEEGRQDNRAVIQAIEAAGLAKTTREVQSTVVKAVCEGLDLEYGACWMIDKTIQATSFATQYGNLGPEYEQINRHDHYKYGQGLGGKAWAARDAIFVPDLSEIKDSRLVKIAQKAGAVSAISVPFIVNDEVAGVLIFLAFKRLHPSNDRLQAMRKIAFLVGQTFGKLQDLEHKKEEQQRINDSVVSCTKQLTDSVGQLNSLSKTMTATAEGTSGQAREVTSASANVSGSIEAVAGGATQMLASIQEIARSAQNSARIAQSAVESAQVCTKVVAKLGDSSQQINKVVKLISSVAQQTNLLALNATIEAARAGEAGKGFAVVAHEVKELAKETARATEEIGAKIEVIQTDTKTAIQSIEDISGVIGEIDAASSQIAAAVEEQSATTKEIGRNVNEAAREAGAITHNIAQVAATAQETARGATETAATAHTLHEVTLQLDALVASLQADSAS